eukprot:CAMPEP_0117750754 /NCGR_PEP_ID=MMETSP0947-20121206/10566_1 /TAXON_ID=44440 /ORGANISM="Chattonella subsalsa, Strain CCMP2191" /LENGTH=262 /DNA_ID=CAMNT_0005569001 /DNA_START=413 /DNA_END=1201 /DNA_ORIENTATION=+
MNWLVHGYWLGFVSLFVTVLCTEASDDYFYYDDFCDDKGNWTVLKGNWLLNTTACTYFASGDIAHSYISTSENMTDYEVSWRMFVSASCEDSKGAGLIFRRKSRENFYYAGLTPNRGTLYSKQVGTGLNWEELDTVVYNESTGGWITGAIRVEGSKFNVSLYHESLGLNLTMFAKDASINNGAIGLRSSNCPVIYDYIKVRLLPEPTVDGSVEDAFIVTCNDDTDCGANEVCECNEIRQNLRASRSLLFGKFQYCVCIDIML